MAKLMLSLLSLLATNSSVDPVRHIHQLCLSNAQTMKKLETKQIFCRPPPRTRNKGGESSQRGLCIIRAICGPTGAGATSGGPSFLPSFPFPAKLIDGVP